MIFKGFTPALNLAALLAVTLLSSSLLHAGASNKSGNPYGNGTHFQTTGTFSSVVRGENLTGTMMFSTGLGTNSSTNSSSGNCNIIYAGYLYFGNSQGMWDPSQETITGVFQAGNTLSGSNSTVTYPQIYNTNVFPVLIPLVTNQITTVNQYQIVTNNTLTGLTNQDGTLNTLTTITTIITNSYQTNNLFTNYIGVEPKGTNTFLDTIYMVGSFSGNMKNDYPNQTFSATGSITQQQLYPQQVTGAEGTVPVQVASPLVIPVSVQGVRISDTFANYQSVANDIPYSQTSYKITNVTGL